MDWYLTIGTFTALFAGIILLHQTTKKPVTKDNRINDLAAQMQAYKSRQSSSLSDTNTRNITNDIKNENKETLGCKVTILFGSQTGTAEGYAQVLGKTGRHEGFLTQVIDLEEYNPEEQLANETCVIFIVATYGEGDPTDNAIPFMKYIKDKNQLIQENAYANVNYTVFGLGNKQYEYYNVIGRTIDKQMEKFGAKRIYKHGEGDDDALIDEDFDAWKENLWETIKSVLMPNSGNKRNGTKKQTNEIDKMEVPELEYTCTVIPSVKSDEMNGEYEKVDTLVPPNTHIKTSTKHFFTAKQAKVIVNKELRQSIEDGGSTLHIEFDLKDIDITYNTADNLAVLPENSSLAVERLANRLGYDLSQWVHVTSIEHNEIVFPTPSSIQTILTRYLDIQSAPRKSPLRQLAAYATDLKEREKILYLVSKDGRDEYAQWILNEHRSFVDVIEEFSSIQIPLVGLLQVVPFLLPRYYTISSSSTVHPNRVHITVTILKTTTPSRRLFSGVCSTYLSELAPLSSHTTNKKLRVSRPGEQGKHIPRQWPMARIFVRKSTFELPNDPLKPIIMIGPGTGIAPMRAFLQERAALLDKGTTIGPSLLFFGCRYREKDFIYKDELEAYKSQGVLTHLYCAFSRDQVEKIYVQHLLEEEGKYIWELIHNDLAHIYVCGATSMGNDVLKVLKSIVEAHGNYSHDEATVFLKQLHDSHRFIQELWA